MERKKFDVPGLVSAKIDGKAIKVRKLYDGREFGIDDYYNLMSLMPDEARSLAVRLNDLADRMEGK